MAQGFEMLLMVLFSFISCVSHLTVCSAFTDDLERYIEAVRENRVQLTSLSKPTTSPILQTQKPPDARILDLYCFENVEQLSYQDLWTSVCFDLNLKEHRYEVYSGTNESHVFHLFESEATNWGSFFSFYSRDFCFSPFQKSCIGIYTARSYQLNLVLQEFDHWLVGCTIGGVLLFLFASQLCRSTIFYYLAGISIGVMTSILMIFIIVGRLFTKKFTVMVVSLAAGSSLTLWLMKWLWINLQMALEFYRDYLIGYLVFSALLSFAICYYLGPITNGRLLDLLKWFLQCVAAFLIYSGIQSAEVAYAVIGVLLIGQVVAFYRH